MKSGLGDWDKKPEWWGQAGFLSQDHAETRRPAYPPMPCDFPGMLLGEAGGSLVDAPEFKLVFT